MKFLFFFLFSIVFNSSLFAQLIGESDEDLFPITTSVAITGGKIKDKSIGSAGFGIQLHTNAAGIERLLSFSTDLYYLGLSKRDYNKIKYGINLKTSASLNLTKNISVGVVGLLGGPEKFDTGYRLSFKTPIRKEDGKAALYARIDLERYTDFGWKPEIVNIGVTFNPFANSGCIFCDL